jgi:CHASE2 domain-containing sensor protein
MLHDLYATPFARNGTTPGVEIQANVLHTLLTGRRIKEGVPRWGRVLIVAACAALAAVVAGVFGRRGLLVVVLMWVAVAAIAGFVFAWADVWLPTVAPSFALVFGAVVQRLLRR